MLLEFCGDNFNLIKVVMATKEEMDCVLQLVTAQVGKFRKKEGWDGNVRLAWWVDGFWYLPAGCWKRLMTLLQPDPTTYRKAYEVRFTNARDFFDKELSVESLEDFVSTLNVPFEDVQEQVDVLWSILAFHMSTHHIATGFGKTFLAYLLGQYTMQMRGTEQRNGKTLMIVPRVNLVEQCIDDFEFNPEHAYMRNCPVHMNLYGICGGFRNYCTYKEADFVVGTYQSLSNLPEDMLYDITTVICDEAHTAKAVSVRDVVRRCRNASIITGVSGTMAYMDDADRLTIDSYVGPQIEYRPVREQIDKGRLPRVDIQPICLKYNEVDPTYDLLRQARGLPRLTHEAVRDLGSAFKALEFEYLYTGQALLGYILQLCKAITDKGQNVLVIFKNRIPVLNLFHAANARGQKCHMILGGTPYEVRQGIKQQIENEKGWILVATDGTMSMGVSINNLHALVICLIGHSPHVTLQAIGRMLRKHKDKMPITVAYDVSNDISKFATKFDLRHADLRNNYYHDEKYVVRPAVTVNAEQYKQYGQI